MVRCARHSSGVKGFLSPLRTEDLLDGKRAKLTAALKYVTEVEAIGLITVPRGFVTDYASVPRGLWNIFPPHGKYSAGAVVHDYLYRRTLMDRAICDRVFLEAMEVLGVSWFSRRVIYRAVRLFGGAARHREVSNERDVEKADPVGGGQSLSMGPTEID